MKSLFPIFIAGILLLAGCQSEPSASTSESREDSGSSLLSIPTADRDSALHYVEKQLEFGPRVPNSEEHEACAQWLADKLRSFEAKVIEQDFQAERFDGIKLNGTNIIGQFNPEAGKRILLAAHWDTRFIADSRLLENPIEEPVPGADDGASGVAVLLEVARQIHLNPVEIGVDIIFFDAEDQGQNGNGDENSWGLGAQHWARHPHTSGYDAKYGILLDMVGARNARFSKESWSLYYARDIVDQVWSLANNLGYGNYFVMAEGGGVTDDHYFVNKIAGIKMIDIINKPTGSETGFGDHWHTPRDNIDVIDSRTLRAVGNVILNVVYRENDEGL